jgi:hypothetical protein
MKKLMVIVALGTLGIGCKKKDEAATAEKGAAADKGGGALPALTAEPAPGELTPAEKQPFETVKLRMLDKREANGWPKYELYNLGTKPVTFAAIYGYAYDKDGKQVARTKVPLSWNGKAEPGKKADWDLALGMPDDKVPATAVAYATCYNSIKFEGDTDQTMDNARCPEQMAKP